MPRKTIILTNKLFHKLWDGSKGLSEQEYLDLYLKRESEEYIDFNKKYEIETFLAHKLLKKIYELSNMSFVELKDRTGLKNPDIADRYCIAIRNIQQWSNGKAKCPSYVMLMIMRDEHMLNFDGMVTTEWEAKFRNTYPAIYSKHDVIKTEKRVKKIRESAIPNSDRYEKYKRQLDIKTDVDRILKETEYLNAIITKSNFEKQSVLS